MNRFLPFAMFVIDFISKIVPTSSLIDDAHCTPSFDPKYKCNVTLGRDVHFQWILDPEMEILRGHLQTTAKKEVFMGWGISHSGKMVGSDVIVYLPDEGIMRYELNTYSQSGATPSLVQDLNYTDFFFDSDTRSLSFSFERPLKTSYHTHLPITPDLKQFVIYSVGATKELMHHRTRGQKKIIFSEGEGSFEDFKEHHIDDSNEKYIHGNEMKHRRFLGLNKHGKIMSLAWGALLPIGVLTARYFRPLNDPNAFDSTPNCRKKSWILIHKSIQLSATFLVGLGCVEAYYLVNRKGGLRMLSAHTQLHCFLGVLLAVSLCAQAVIGLMRPPPSLEGAPPSTERYRFQKFHRGLGYTTLFLGFVQIYLGVGLDVHSPPNKTLLLVILVYTILSLAFEKLRVGKISGSTAIERRDSESNYEMVSQRDSNWENNIPVVEGHVVMQN